MNGSYRGETSAQVALGTPTHRRIYRFPGRRMAGTDPPLPTGALPAPNTQRERSSGTWRCLGCARRAARLNHSRCARSSMTDRMYCGRLSPTADAACDHNRISSVVRRKWMAVEWWTFMIKKDEGEAGLLSPNQPCLPPYGPHRGARVASPRCPILQVGNSSISRGSGVASPQAAMIHSPSTRSRPSSSFQR